MKHEKDISGSVGSSKVRDKRLKTGKKEKGDDCRCKEVSKKSIGGMLKLMISDLAIWEKKPKKR